MRTPMGSVDYRSLAADIVREVGGEDNIASATHCATPLRLRLHDEGRADKATIETLPGVITVMQAGGFLSMAIQFGWLDVASQTYVILAAAADALFYFLPMFLAVTAARRFQANQFTAMAVAGALVYPSRCTW